MLIKEELCGYTDRMTKEEFCGYIDRMKDVCRLLKLLMGADYEDILCFCTEADFGRKWHPGMVTDENGNDIDLSTAEKLYDFLVNKGSG